MRVPRIIVIVLSGVLAGCHSQTRRIAEHVVEFSEGWTRHRTVLSLPADWDVRVAHREGAKIEWLFRLRTLEGSYSEECYSVAPALVSHRVAGTECERAPKVNLAVIAAGEPAPHGVSYENREFPMSGRILGKALLSQNGHWIAVISESPSDQPDRRANPMPALGGGEPSNGEVFVDVYGTATGQRQAGARSEFHGFGARILFEQAFWVEDSAFVMPLNTLASRCFLISPESQ